jgi:hypothetical protein
MKAIPVAALCVVMALCGIEDPAYAVRAAGSQSHAPAATTTDMAAAHVTTPRAEFGWDIGDDYRLVNYTQYERYLHRLDKESDRVAVVAIGKTAEGRTEYAAIVTSPANHRRLEQLQEINRRLALADGLTDDEARQLTREAKAVVWIDGGLHATEVLGAQQLIELVYRLASRTDAETMRILNDVIVLCTLINPDGMELVSNWYMRNPEEKRRSTAGIPRLYQKYIGHDNNRDFYMMNQPESVNANRILYREWFPVIMYNHHQTGPAGSVLFAPPFRDPFNYHFDPLIPLGIDIVGAAIHTRLATEGKPGGVMRSAAPYSTWFNGGIRTTSYFHNQIGILTEMIGNPTPIEIPFVPDMHLPRADVPYPIAPQPWRFRQSIEYSMTTNYAVLDVASERKEDFLFNMYRMAKNATERGGRDSWTMRPKIVERAKEAAGRLGWTRGAAPARVFNEVLRDPTLRDPRGFIVPADQPDFLTAIKFVNVLIRGGVFVDRATAPFTVAGRSYPAGSFVVKAAQPFRAHLMDMFEPQDHPNDFPYPGGPPRPPYDVTGYNIAYSMGIRFERVLDRFDGPFERLPDVVAPPSGRITPAPAGGGYLLGAETNDAFAAVNRLLTAKEEIYRLKAPLRVKDKTFAAGTFFIAARPTTAANLERLAAQKGLGFDGVAPLAPADRHSAVRLRPIRIGLWDTYGGSMPSGWTRWLLEQFEFPFEVVFAQSLDAGALNERFDVLIFVDGAIPARDVVALGQPPAGDIPEEFRPWLGSVTVSRTVPELKKFVKAGGTLLTIGSSTVLATHLGLPVRSALTERGPSGQEQPLPAERFYVPGAILEAKIDTAHPLAYGMTNPVNVFFDHSEAFRLLPGAQAGGLKAVAWFDTAAPLRSGWAWGQEHLDQAVEIVDAPIGKGHLVLFGPEIVWRGQPHGTFKFLFNGIFLGQLTN